MVGKFVTANKKAGNDIFVGELLLKKTRHTACRKCNCCSISFSFACISCTKRRPIVCRSRISTFSLMHLPFLCWYFCWYFCHARSHLCSSIHLTRDWEVMLWLCGKSKVFAIFLRCNKPADAILTGIPVKSAAQHEQLPFFSITTVPAQARVKELN